MGLVDRSVRRFGWALADQLFSSVTNFAVALVVARSVTSEAFGAFSLVFATYVLAMGAARAIVAEPLTVRFSAASSEAWRRACRAATGATISVGILIGSGCIAVGWIARGRFGTPLVLLGILMPGLLLQDTWRFAFFAARRGRGAFVNDLVWAFGLFPFLILLVANGTPSIASVVLVWGGAANVAAVFGMFQASLTPTIGHTGEWFRSHRDLVFPFLAEFGAANGSQQVVTYAAGLTSLSAAGALRGGQVLLGPLNVLLMGVRLAVLPDAVRLVALSRERLVRAMLGVGILVSLGAVVWGVLAFLVPREVGLRLLGHSWDGAHQVVLPLALATIGSGFIMGAVIGLRALVRPARSLRARMASGALVVLGGATGAIAAGALGAAVGTAVASGLGAIWWWVEFLAAAGEPSSIQPGPSDRFYQDELVEEAPA